MTSNQPSSDQRFAVIRSSDGTTHKVALPVVIGADASYDFSLAGDQEHTYWISCVDGDLVVYEEQQQTRLSIAELSEKTGLNVLGTTTSEEPSLLQWWQLLEANWVKHLKQGWLKKILETKPQSVRNVWYGTIIALMATLILAVMVYDQQGDRPDLSDRIYPMHLGSSDANIYGNILSFPKVHHRVNLSLQGVGRAPRYLIHFKLWGQTHDGRTKLLINDHVVWQNIGQSQCIDRGCEETVIYGGENPEKYDLPKTVTIINTEPTKPWAISRIKVEAQKPIDAVSLKRVEHYFEEATDTFARQNVSKANLFRARDLMEKISDIRGHSFIPGHLDVEIDALSQEINADVSKFVEHMYFKIERAIRMERFGEANMLVLEGKAFFKDPSSKVAQDLERFTKKIRKVR